ncbi:MAG: hypothetical protein JWN50_162 [Parcubacteria group bacterium]|nr:hypothetical protein [Parcubacteria group bacterium]
MSDNEELDPIEPEDLDAKPVVDDEEDDVLVPGVEEPKPLSQVTAGDLEDEEIVEESEEEDEMDDLGKDDWEV